MPISDRYRPETIHAALGADFFDVVAPAAFPTHVLRRRGQRHAATIGLDTLTEAEWIDHFGRFVPLPGSFAEPLALRYHGHQFRSYNPYLGDGRGFLFAQCRDGDGRLLDLGTKGSGQTPWSRQGDGRLTLKGGVREVLASEMLEALGVDTSKALSLIETGEALTRQDEPSPTRSSVLVRLSHSHIRIGTFQRLLARRDEAGLATLLDHAVTHYLPDARRDDDAATAVAFLEAVAARIAETGAAWTAAGFVHGVLNTDNINITGESFDYGPWRFLPVLDPAFTAAYFDHSGLYAFGRQPQTLLWNLARLAECLLFAAEAPALEAALTGFQATFQRAYGAALRRRLGLAAGDAAAEIALSEALFRFLAETRAPFEQTLFDWHGGLARLDTAFSGPNGDHYRADAFAGLEAALAGFEPDPAARHDHPYFAAARPETLLIDEVEALWAPIAEADDWSAFDMKLAAIDRVRDAYGRDAPG
jgi:uncharacterized protein YdiU (UPF0061 family)